MATKTYPELTAETTVEDADLLATWRGVSGPLKRLTASLLRTYMTALGFTRSVLSKSGSYTVLAADQGSIINCTSTFTLALTAASTLGTGFNFVVRNNGTGYITIDPSGSDTIDGRNTIIVYPGEAFEVDCISSSAFVTNGRSQDVTISFQTLATGQTEVEWTAGITDDEFKSYTIDYVATPASSSIPQFRFKQGGSYGSDHVYGRMSYASGAFNGAANFGQAGVPVGQASSGTITGTARFWNFHGVTTGGAAGMKASTLEAGTPGTTEVTGGPGNDSDVTGLKFLFVTANTLNESVFHLTGHR